MGLLGLKIASASSMHVRVVLQYTPMDLVSSFLRLKPVFKIPPILHRVSRLGEHRVSVSGDPSLAKMWAILAVAANTASK